MFFTFFGYAVKKKDFCYRYAASLHKETAMARRLPLKKMVVDRKVW